ncbi:unnamed protein product [Urochloa humidicola]
MSPLASRETGDSGSGAPRAGAATDTQTRPTAASASTTPNAPPRPPPSTRTGLRLESTSARSSNAQLRPPRPGALFQEIVLHHFYTTAVPAMSSKLSVPLKASRRKTIVQLLLPTKPLLADQ